MGHRRAGLRGHGVGFHHAGHAEQTHRGDREDVGGEHQEDAAEDQGRAAQRPAGVPQSQTHVQGVRVRPADVAKEPELSEPPLVEKHGFPYDDEEESHVRML